MCKCTDAHLYFLGTRSAERLEHGFEERAIQPAQSQKRTHLTGSYVQIDFFKFFLNLLMALNFN